ncbi:MAG: response regulator [Deltaproteobacteria bacterium]|nr:response regulator [Deltaproteobacteria bacterium]MCB9788963.1 response regulator [Deltaproteobacteria bacterium]
MVIAASDAASASLGWSGAELVGMSLEAIDLGPVGGAPPLDPPRGSVRFETRYRDHVGAAFPVDVTVTGTRYDSAPAMLVLFRPIPAEREAKRLRVISAGTRRRKAVLELAKHEAMQGGDFVAAATTLTEITAEAMDVDRASVWLLSEDRARLRCVDTFDRQTGEHSVGDELAAVDAPRYFEAVASGRALDAADAVNDLRSCEFREYLARRGIVSLLDAPIRVAGEVVGVVCHEQVGSLRMWKAEEIDFAGEIADQAALALLAAERRRSEAAHRALEVEVQRARHFESLGALAGGLAHDFNNLLMTVSGSASLALQQSDPESPLRRHLVRIEDAAARAAELTSQILAYAGKGRLFAEPIELGAFLSDAIGRRAALPARGRMRCEQPETPIMVSGDREQLERVFDALVANASEAIAEDGEEVWARVRLIELESEPAPPERVGASLVPGTYAVLEICDDGCGLAPTARARAYDPFFTTKPSHRGLGLAAALGITRAHGGAMELRPRPGGGTMVRVYLPAIEAGRRLGGRPRAEAVASADHREGAILVVDDESSVREVAVAILEDAGYPVLQARDGVEGVEVIRERGDEVAAVLLDLSMPRLDGLGALREMRELRPELPVLLQSGFHEDDTVTEIVVSGQAEFLEKPYGAAVLVTRLRKLLDS